MLIADEDCDTEYPEHVEEQDAKSNMLDTQSPTLLLASAHVARLLAPLAKLSRSLCITTDAIRKFESHMASCLQLFPSHLQLIADAPLDPLTMAPILQFQNTRILLHRHNISPACSLEQRINAIGNCALAAEDTTRVMSRCFLKSDHIENTEARLLASASSFICTHIWRCMLFLSFRQQWNAFHVLLRYAALIGDSRPINISCGRHLSLLLHCLITRHQRHDVSTPEEDEELIVLLSGDLQAGTNSWVWGNAETGTFLSRRQKHSRSSQASPDTTRSLSSSPRETSWDTHLTDEEMRQWGGWQRVYEQAQWLEETQRTGQANNSQQQGYVHPSPDIQRIPPRTDLSQSAHTTRSRMTIASITDSSR